MLARAARPLASVEGRAAAAPPPREGEAAPRRRAGRRCVGRDGVAPGRCDPSIAAAAARRTAIAEAGAPRREAVPWTLRMGDVINLNRYRKARERAEREKQAEANRARHGRTRSERDAARREQQRQAAEIEGKRLEPEGDEPQGP